MHGPGGPASPHPPARAADHPRGDASAPNRATTYKPRNGRSCIGILSGFAPAVEPSRRSSLLSVAGAPNGAGLAGSSVQQTALSPGAPPAGTGRFGLASATP